MGKITVDLDLNELEQDPYPAYATLRRQAPVAWVPEANVWFVTRYDDCMAVGRGELPFGGAREHPTLQRVFGEPNVLTADGPEHSDLRAGVDPCLQPEPVNASVDQLVRPVARRYLAELDGRTSAELMSAYLEPVSVEALRHVMGLDDLVDADTLRRWFAELNVGVSNFAQRPEDFAVADRAGREIEEVVRPRLERLRKNPDESMLSHMLWAGREDGSPRPVELIMPSLKVILLGGMQEPGHAAGTTLLGLLSRPEQLALTYEDPESYLPLAIQEGLRWIAPIGAVERQATADVRIGTAEIEAGAIVMTVLGSANRDEARFPDPDVFDLHRTGPHQAFGNGKHFCAGHYFARQVERIMLEELLLTVPGLHQAPGQEPVVNGWVFRAPKALPVTWNPAAQRECTTLRPAVVEPAQPGTRLLQVTSMRWEAEGVVSVELRDPDGRPLDQWAPGAHVDLWLVPGRGSHYSLCGEPGDRNTWRVAVLREAHAGGGSECVHERLRPGSYVHVSAPRNTFPLTEASAYEFVAGGIGITPLLPMLRTAGSAGRPFRLTYCGRSRRSMAFVDDLVRYGDQVEVFAKDEGERADLAEVVTRAGRTGATLYACGPERMISLVEQLAGAADIELHVERFAAGDAHRDDDRPFDVVLARTGRRIRVPESQTLLDVLREDGLDIPNVCREGNCGSCETPVLGGAVDHRDVLLTQRQRAANDRMMLCVSRAAGDQIVLDL